MAFFRRLLQLIVRVVTLMCVELSRFCGIALAIILAGCQSIDYVSDNNDKVFQRVIASHKQYGATPKDWAQHELQTDQIHSCVIIAPRYSPKIFEPYVKRVTQIANGRFPVYEIETNQGRKISLIRVGVGAVNTLDAALALAGTSCEKILFIGSVGSLSPDAAIGDIIIPSQSVCGSGADFYLTTGSFLQNNVIGKSYSSDSETSQKLFGSAQRFSQKEGIKVLDKKVFSIDTMFGEYLYFSEIKNLGCEAIEMETATLFHAAKVIGKKAAALLYVVDCPLKGQAVYHGRTEDTEIKKVKVKKTLVPQIALNFFE